MLTSANLRDLSTAYLPPSSSYPTSYAEPEDLYKVCTIVQLCNISLFRPGISKLYLNYLKTFFTSYMQSRKIFTRFVQLYSGATYLYLGQAFVSCT